MKDVGFGGELCFYFYDINVEIDDNSEVEFNMGKFEVW